MNTKEAYEKYGKWAVVAGTAAIVRLDEKPGITPSQAFKRAMKKEDKDWLLLSYREETVLAIANRSRSRGKV